MAGTRVKNTLHMSRTKNIKFVLSEFTRYVKPEIYMTRMVNGVIHFKQLQIGASMTRSIHKLNRGLLS